MSRGDSQSNPSEYDFGDLNDMQQDEIEDEEVNMMKPDLQRLDMNLMLVLNRFPLSDTIIGNFGACQIKYSQLKSLGRNDLEKLGITDNKLQDEMLEEFKHLEGQDASMKDFMSYSIEENDEEKDSRAVTAVEVLQQHLYRINTLLTAITFRVGTSQGNTAGVIVNQRFCSAEVVMDLLGQLATHTAEMEEIIKELADPEAYEKEYQMKKQKEKRKKCIVLMSTLGFFIAGFYIAKRLGFKKVF